MIKDDRPTNKDVLCQYIRRGPKVNKKFKAKDGTVTVRSVSTQASGLLVAINDGGYVKIGYSLCCRRDRFNRDIGFDLAVKRAEHHCGTDRVLFCHNAAERRKEIWEVARGDEVMIHPFRVPQSIRENLKGFITRAQKYWKEAEMPPWAEDVLHGSDVPQAKPLKLDMV